MAHWSERLQGGKALIMMCCSGAACKGLCPTHPCCSDGVVTRTPPLLAPQGNCTETDPYTDYEGSLLCLTEGSGERACPPARLPAAACPTPTLLMPAARVGAAAVAQHARLLRSMRCATALEQLACARPPPPPPQPPLLRPSLGPGDVAFTKHETALELPAATQAGLRLLCPAGGCAPLEDFESCNIAKAPAYAGGWAGLRAGVAGAKHQVVSLAGDEPSCGGARVVCADLPAGFSSCPPHPFLTLLVTPLPLHPCPPSPSRDPPRLQERRRGQGCAGSGGVRAERWSGPAVAGAREGPKRQMRRALSYKEAQRPS